MLTFGASFGLRYATVSDVYQGILQTVARSSGMNLTRLRSVVSRTFSDWNDDDAPRLGAALAFYMLLSLAPLLLLILAGVSLIFGRSTSQAEILDQVRRIVGDDGAHAVLTMIQHSQEPSSGGWASLFGAITLLFGASGVFNELRAALKTIWDVDPKTCTGFAAIVKNRFFSFGMVVIFAFLVLISLTLNTAVAALGKFFGERLPAPEAALGLMNSSLSLVVIWILFALIFKYVPGTRTPWNEVLIGGAVSALLFTVGNVLIGLYLGKAGIASTYGAAGSLIVIILWAYYSAQVFFLGAEFTHVLAEMHGATASMGRRV